MNLLTLTTLMASLVTFAPLADAIAKLNAKTPIGSALKTVDWAEIPAQLRETAQFSAGVESARVLQAIQDRIKAELNLETEDLGDGKTIGFSRSRFIDKLRTIAREEGLTPADPDIQGTIQDITSIPRLGMIHDIQTAKAEGFARWKADQDEGALQAYPAWEFVRVESRTKERPDWPSRWAEAGGEFYGRRMIAKKDSPVWEKLSIFGVPWPPFDFGSGMGLEEVAWDEAVQLGVIPANGHVAPGGQAFTDRLEASTAGLSEEFQDKLRVFFGDQVEITGGKAKWAGTAEAGNEFNPDQPRAGDGKWAGGGGLSLDQAGAEAASKMGVPLEQVRVVTPEEMKAKGGDGGADVLGNYDKTNGEIWVASVLPEGWSQGDVILHEGMHGKFEAFKANRAEYSKLMAGQPREALFQEKFSPTEYSDRIWDRMKGYGEQIHTGGGRAMFDHVVNETLAEMARAGGVYDETPEPWAKLYRAVFAKEIPKRQTA